MTSFRPPPAELIEELLGVLEDVRALIDLDHAPLTANRVDRAVKRGRAYLQEVTP